MPTPEQNPNGTQTERRNDHLQVVTETSNPEETPRKMTRAEAGRKGGLSTKKRYGEDYFSEIGRMGGKKGGESTKRRYGVEFYQEIGRKGGSR